jgi:superfamily I DNA and RNA helicase
VFRGRGGAGKTVILLQLAYHAFDERKARSLLLTYNRALIADIRRTMALFGMPSTVARGGIRIDSVMSFIGRVLNHFKLIAPGEDFLASYEANCATLADLLGSGDISAEDVAAMKRNDAPEFAFDHVFIDEGQDWPESEIAILRALYPPERLVIADGVDQFVRDSVADWQSGVEGAS